MATYKFKGPDGKTYRFSRQGDATPAPETPTTPKRMDFSAEKPNMLKEVGKIALETPLKAAGLAKQGLTGLGVAAQRAIEGKSSLDRTADAMKPGFVPESGEKIGALLGPTIPAMATGNIPAAMAIAGSTKAGERLNAGDDLGDAAQAGAIDAAVTGVAGGTFEAGSAILKPLYRTLASVVKGTGRKVVDTVFDAAEGSPDTVKQAASELFEAISGKQKEALEGLNKAGVEAGSLVKGAQNLAGQELNKAGQSAQAASKAAASLPKGNVAPQDVAHKAAAFSEALGKHANDVVEQAAKTLKVEPTIPGDKVISLADSVKAGIKTRSLGLGRESRKAERALNEWTSSLKKLVTPDIQAPVANTSIFALPQEAPVQAPKMVSEAELKKVIRALDDDTDWEGIAGTQVEKTLRGLRTQVDKLLKSQNPEYAKAIEPASKILGQKHDFDDILRLNSDRKRGVTLTSDQTITKLESLFKGGKSVSREGLQKAGFADVEKGAASLAQNKARDTAIKSAEHTGDQALSQADKIGSDAVQAAESKGSEMLGRAESQLVPGVELSQVRSMAESAAKDGLSSPSGERLIEMLRPYFGERAESEAARMVQGAAKEVFTRGRGKTMLSAAGEAVSGDKGGILIGGDKLGKRLFAPTARTIRAGTSPLVNSMLEDEPKKRKEN